ncbi:allergen Api m 6-like [Centruroides sculpturatus]|uniref:allergen Api m 6-like n=1 Tax=Centruroides sculpturatus TaxID=218467 RepID=UPI000C6CD60F|nr:allergen Api m 6-like [Centruroides sculpturatus]
MAPRCSEDCQEGCVCKNGYVRIHKEWFAYCIPESNCKKCPDNEHFDICTRHCQKNCKNKDEVVPCAMICMPGCICNSGYVREVDENSSCIPVEDCNN